MELIQSSVEVASFGTLGGICEEAEGENREGIYDSEVNPPKSTTLVRRLVKFVL